MEPFFPRIAEWDGLSRNGPLKIHRISGLAGDKELTKTYMYMYIQEHTHDELDYFSCLSSPIQYTAPISL